MRLIGSPCWLTGPFLSRLPVTHCQVSPGVFRTFAITFSPIAYHGRMKRRIIETKSVRVVLYWLDTKTLMIFRSSHVMLEDLSKDSGEVDGGFGRVSA